MLLNPNETWLPAKIVAEYCKMEIRGIRTRCQNQKWLGCDLEVRKVDCTYSKQGSWEILLSSIPPKYQQMIMPYLVDTTTPAETKPAPKLTAPIISADESLFLAELTDTKQQKRVNEKLKKGLSRHQQKAFQQKGVLALAGNYGNRQGDTLFNRHPTLKDAAKTLLLQHPDVKEATLYKVLRAKFPDIDFSYHTFRNNLAPLKALPEFKFIHDPSSAKSAMRPAYGTSAWDIIRPNQRWEIDDSPIDILTSDGRRHKLNLIIDVYTRYARFMLIERVNSTMTRAHLRQALLDAGIPEEIVVDNGKNYVDSNFQTACAACGINLIFCLPGRGDQKPHAERTFRTLQHGILSLAEGFIGHNVQERKRIEDRNKYLSKLIKKAKTPETDDEQEGIRTGLSINELKLWLAQATHDYNNSVHSTLKCSPQAALAKALSEGFTPNRIKEPHILNILMQDVVRSGNRLPIIGKKGVLCTIGGVRKQFSHPDMALHGGKEAVCRYDAINNTITVLVDGEFLCIAREWNDLTSEEQYDTALKAQQQYDTHNRRAIKAVFKKPDPSDALINRLAENLPADIAIEASNVVSLTHDKKKSRKQQQEQENNEAYADAIARLAAIKNKTA